jgi:8-oxo-dGTP pyrophosphatase MutT (NUDIX family)
MAELLDLLWQDAWELGVASAVALAGDGIAPVQKGKSKDFERKVKCDLGHEHNSHAAAGLLIRHKPPGEKRKWLLQKRGDVSDSGMWEIFGGALHKGEPPYQGAWREAEEEAGKLPSNLTLHHKVINDHGGWTYTTFLMDSPELFNPTLNGSTPGEVAGAGWFTHKEVKGLPLHHGFADCWDVLRHSTQDTAINAAMAKRWKNPFPGGTAAPLPDDPWEDIYNRLIARRVPPLLAGPLASAFLTWESNDGASSIIAMIRTLVTKIAGVLLRRRAGTITSREAVQEIDTITGNEPHMRRIATTEISEAVNAAARETYIVTNEIEYVQWVVADAGACAVCKMNAAAGAIPIDHAFPSGAVLPPEHPNCRCAIIPAAVQPPTRHEEMLTPWSMAKSAETPYLSSHHAPIGHEGLWHSKNPPLQLPAYIQNIRNALMRSGMDERKAHAMAVAAVERWAKGDLKWGPTRHVTPEVRAASADAVRQWEALRANHP